MGMTAILGMFAGIYHWFPKMYGKAMNKRMGMVHFWITIICGYGVFLPMHFLGEGGLPRRYYENTNFPMFDHFLDLNIMISIFASVGVIAQVIFFFNFFYSIFRGPRSSQNPWNSNSLEWTTPVEHVHGNWIGEIPTVYRWPYDYSKPGKDKDENWILDKFSYRLLDKDKVQDNILESKDYVAEEISLAMSNAKITSKNIALSIPVTSAIIRVVTSPLMSDEELQKAIETDSLWENLVQLADNLNDYSVFHQVINRNSKTNTMEILFVASKLSDVNSYSAIAKKAGLNPVILDVKCFTLKNAHDNTKFKSINQNTNSAILEISDDENYLMIIHNNTPVITDVFLRQPEKDLISQISDGPINDESEAVIRRYSTVSYTHLTLPTKRIV